MKRDSVIVKIPADPGYLALLRTAVGGFAARDHFTLDQVDDLRMAVEEAAVQILRQARGDRITLEVAATEPGIEIRLQAEVASDEPLIDESSFSWTILRALVDNLEVEMLQSRAVIVLTKHRTIVSGRQHI